MWPLLLFSILSVSCIIERLIFWNKVNNYKKISNEFLVNQFTDIAYLKSLSNKNIGYDPYKKLLFKIKDFDLSNQRNLSIALSISIQSIQYEFEKFNNFFATTISIAPLLGLLGTVFGLINSFSFIELGNAGLNADEVTGGISEALVSTAAGLIIAIFTLIFSNYFKSIKIKKIKLLNEFCGRFESFFALKNFN
ncbi:Ferric siderophore transport system [Prochlorococcus marinus str. MIT 9201]|uniref:Ferric siderophore transport system n=1 Tax=Prochlorococcus marinus str. MIT 9201 TaxID=93057 RepID=A0A0A2A369_PROMR|nr:MotA/TolQ/ExbB proton channel family protein [Prochlorococcus marinus]KGF96342.1 Ferric siderophore transport system [Prochlorococcus marinus str. MIT 9201]